MIELPRKKNRPRKLKLKGFSAGVMIVRPRLGVQQFWHITSEEEKQKLSVYLLRKLRKKHYFKVPKEPPTLEFDIKDIASYPEYMRDSLSQKRDEYVEQMKQYIFWKDRVAEIDLILSEKSKQKAWDVLITVYRFVEFHEYEAPV